jgi:PleD family two-component response regulator
VRDGVTPGPRVFDEDDLRRLLAWEVQRATRYQDFLSLCLARPDHPEAVSPEILGAMARRVVGLLRSTDLVGLVSDCIAIVLVHTPDNEATAITERVRELLEAAAFPPAPGAAAIRSILRMGLASFPTDATSETALLDRAQARLAAARRGSSGSPLTS